MLQFMEFVMSVGWKVLLLAVSWKVFRCIRKYGSGTVQDILETMVLGIKAGCLSMRKRIAIKLLKQRREEEEPQKTEHPGKVEATIV